MVDGGAKYIRKIKILNETIWEGNAESTEVKKWLENFEDANITDQNKGKLNALYLLSKFAYFGSKEMRQMLVSLYRDLFKYPIIKNIREKNSNTIDLAFISEEFRKELFVTRFIGIGNPSESGSHLLYYFRQENALPKDLFIHAHQIYKGSRKDGTLALRNAGIKRYVFIDDFCGSGDQATDYSNDILNDMYSLKPDLEVLYLVLFSTKQGIDKVRSNPKFKDMRAVFVLDDSYKCFSPHSRYYPAGSDSISKDFAETMCTDLGKRICHDDFCMKNHPLGYKDNQLLFGFHHNTPDNTLPIIWSGGSSIKPWEPIFRRYPKIYGGLK